MSMLGEKTFRPWEFAAYRPHDRVVCDTSEFPSATRQEFADECDINNIMSRYEKTGVLQHYSRSEPRYLDMELFDGSIPDFHTAMNIAVAAEEAFMQLPAAVRKRFENNPHEFVDFALDDANVAQMREWGLIAPEAEPDAPMRVEVVNPAPAGDPAP